jgi:hypothetical protein
MDFIAVGICDQDRITFAVQFWSDFPNSTRQFVRDVRGNDVVGQHLAAFVLNCSAVHQIKVIARHDVHNPEGACPPKVAEAPQITARVTQHSKFGTDSKL